MNIEPPIALRFHELDANQVANARIGICPHCPRSLEGTPAANLATKHAVDRLQFLQCSRCNVIVALDKP